MSFHTPSLPSGYSSPASSKKVAIPRLQRSGHSQPSKDNRRRVPRACTACRSHKIKCTGDNPKCKHCETTGRECIYIMPRKDRLKIVTERCVQMAGLLNTVKAWASDEDQARIAELLDVVEEDISETRQAAPPSNPDTNDNESKGSVAMIDNLIFDTSERVNIDSLDLLDENLHENDRSRATGFVGPNSEVQWLRTFLLLERADGTTAKGMMPEQRTWSAGPINNEQVSAITFYLDNENIDLDFHVDSYGLPPPEVAEQLLGVYMDKVHSSFPILPRRLFEDQFRRYFIGLAQGTAPRLNAKWQAILNLVFAIGSKYSHLIKASWQADERDHLIYQARARNFAWNESTLTQHPDLPQIQVAGLLAFYYLSVGQTSRAWVVVGVALRFATALGLHVRNEDPSASGLKREVLVRIWWSLYYLERQLSIITGRPSVIVDSCCSVPLPIPFSEQQIADDIDLVNRLRRASSASAVSSLTVSPAMPGELPRTPPGLAIPEANSGSYFKAAVEMGIITQSILSSLYSARTMIRSPEELQHDTQQLTQRLDNWVTKLPADLNFYIHRSWIGQSESVFSRERMLLAFQFCSARILLTRPSLSSLGQAARDTKDGSSRALASACIEAAKLEIDLLPDHPDPSFVYEYGPWWTIVHNLMQALAVLLLSLSYSSAVLQDNIVIASYCTKIIRWLRSLNNPIAERATRVALSCFELVAHRLSLDISGLLVDHSMAYSSPERGVHMDGVYTGIPPMVTSVGYGPVAPTPASTSLLDGHSPTLMSFDPLVAGTAYTPQTDGQLYSDTYYHH